MIIELVVVSLCYRLVGPTWKLSSAFCVTYQNQNGRTSSGKNALRDFNLHCTDHGERERERKSLPTRETKQNDLGKKCFPSKRKVYHTKWRFIASSNNLFSLYISLFPISRWTFIWNWFYRNYHARMLCRIFPLYH